jgi:hypothetical protein
LSVATLIEAHSESFVWLMSKRARAARICAGPITDNEHPDVGDHLGIDLSLGSPQLLAHCGRSRIGTFSQRGHSPTISASIASAGSLTRQESPRKRKSLLGILRPSSYRL